MKTRRHIPPVAFGSGPRLLTRVTVGAEKSLPNCLPNSGRPRNPNKQNIL